MHLIGGTTSKIGFDNALVIVKTGLGYATITRLKTRDAHISCAVRVRTSLAAIVTVLSLYYLNLLEN